MTLDDQAIQCLEATSRLLGKPKSEVVRDAIIDFAERADRPSPSEIAENIALLKEYAATHQPDPAAVAAELAEIRESRQIGWIGYEDRTR